MRRCPAGPSPGRELQRWAAYADGQKARAHADGCHEAGDGGLDRAGLQGLAAMSREARSAMPRVPRNSAWDTGPSQASPWLVMACAKAAKSTCAVRSDFAGRGERIVVAMGADRLQRIAERRRDVTIVDEECSELIPERGRAFAPSREGAGARLEHGALGVGAGVWLR